MELLSGGTIEEIAAEIESLASASPSPRIEELVTLFRDNRERCAELAKAFEQQPGFDPAAESEEDRVAHFARLFDGLVRASPAASVAAYSLGREDVLAEATAEIVELLVRWNLVGSDRDLLQIGCGIGRFEAALAPLVRRAVGIDIAPAMIAAARERCAALPNVTFHLSSGRDLAGFRDGEFQLVYAVDSFPYIVGVGMGLAEALFPEAARVLGPGGEFVILNFSYRDAPERDAEDVARLAAAHAFEVLTNGEKPFRLWNGAAFRLRRSDSAGVP
ncbi:MAG: hypothetical protein JWO56_1059 [Acidobacteria bacterium]|nr:hypothetical protein [Acidobacteriota bacterium]